MHSHEEITRARLDAVNDVVRFGRWLEFMPVSSADVDKEVEALNEKFNKMIYDCYWLTHDEVETLHEGASDEWLMEYQSRMNLWIQVKEDRKDGN